MQTENKANNITKGSHKFRAVWERTGDHNTLNNLKKKKNYGFPETPFTDHHIKIEY